MGACLIDLWIGKGDAGLMNLVIFVVVLVTQGSTDGSWCSCQTGPVSGANPYLFASLSLGPAEPGRGRSMVPIEKRNRKLSKGIDGMRKAAGNGSAMRGGCNPGNVLRTRLLKDSSFPQTIVTVLFLAFWKPGHSLHCY